jgi:hypothetical protein
MYIDIDTYIYIYSSIRLAIYPYVFRNIVAINLAIPISVCLYVHVLAAMSGYPTHNSLMHTIHCIMHTYGSNMWRDYEGLYSVRCGEI